MPLTYRIVQYEPPTRLVLEAESDGLRSLDTIELEKAGPGTRVTYDAVLALKGARAALDLPVHLAFQWIGKRARDGLESALRLAR